MKPLHAWVIIETATEAPACFDGRCPIYWLRRVATMAARKVFRHKDDYRVVRVVVNEIFKPR